MAGGVKFTIGMLPYLLNLEVSQGKDLPSGQRGFVQRGCR